MSHSNVPSATSIQRADFVVNLMKYIVVTESSHQRRNGRKNRQRKTARELAGESEGLERKELGRAERIGAEPRVLERSSERLDAPTAVAAKEMMKMIMMC